MNIDPTRLTDEELISLAVSIRKEMQHRVDDDMQPKRDRRIASRLALESRGVARGWSGYAAISQDDDGMTHVIQPDRDNRLVDIWLRCPRSYAAETVSRLEQVIAAAVAGVVRP